MRTKGTLLLGALAGSVVLAIAVAGASATRLEVSELAIRAVWTSFRWEDGVLRTVCPVTLEGSFHSRIFRKLSGAEIGYITKAKTQKANVGDCGAEGRSLWISAEDGTAQSLPWVLRYDSFTGTLPFARTVKFQVIRLFVKGIPLGMTCRYESEIMRPAYLIAGLNTETGIRRGTIESLRFDETTTIPAMPLETCAATARLAGTAAVTVLEGREAVKIELVA